MIRQLFNRGRSPIGIDMTGRSLHAVQLQRNSRGGRIVAAVSYDRHDPEAELSSKELADFVVILDRQGFVGSEVVLAVPDAFLISDLMELPGKAEAASLQQLARMELVRTHKCNPVELELTTWTLPESVRSGETQHVMAVACPHEKSEQLLEVWDRAGLEVVALDVHTLAMARLIRVQASQCQGITALLKLGWDASHLVILYQGKVVYERALQEGGLSNLVQTLIDRLEIDQEVAYFTINEVGFTSDGKEHWASWPLLTDARGIMATHFTTMLDEVRVSFSYAQHRYPSSPLERLLLTGRGASIPGLCEPVNSTLEMETSVIVPTDVCDCSQALHDFCSDPALTVAVGLAQFDG